MLAEGSGPLPGSPRVQARGLGSEPARHLAVGFGGVTFDLHWPAAAGGAGFEFGLLSLDRAACLPGRPTRAAAHIECAIRWEHDDILHPIEVLPRVAASWEFRGLGTRGVLRRVDSTHYRAELSVTPTQRGCGAALRILAGLVLESCGGLCLHAAAVEVDGGALLFTGPSGAGKSTACELSGATRCFAYDHVALTACPDGYWAWRIPMGGAASLPLTDTPLLPLRGILRVQRGGERPRILPSDPVRAVFDVRRAMDVADPGDLAEDARLSAAQHLCGQLRSRQARIETVLGQPIAPLLSQWLLDAPVVDHG